MAFCLLGLGSNLGDRAQHLLGATTAVGKLPTTRVLGQSTVRETFPVGGVGTQERFLNSALLIETALEPIELLTRLQRIETDLGRNRIHKWGPRKIDIDILLFEQQVLATTELIVPHPWFLVRRFAITPASEIAPSMQHPLIGQSLQQIDDHLRTAFPTTLLLTDDELSPDLLDDAGLVGEVSKISHLKSCQIRSDGIFVNPDPWQSHAEHGCHRLTNPSSSPQLVVATVSWQAKPDAKTQLSAIVPPPRIVVGCVEPTAEFAPWRALANPSKHEAFACALGGTLLPFVLVPRSKDTATEIVAALQASA